MASLPAQQSRRAASSSNQADEGSSSPARAQSSSEAFSSANSQTHLLNDPAATSAAPEPPKETPRPQPDDLRKCWICFSDESEDTPTTSAWKSPCPCALTAHEECILDWVADLEAPQNNRGGAGRGVGGAGGSAIRCPQCKSAITIARPRSAVVSAVAALDRAATRLTWPGLVVTLGGTVVAGAWVHGLASVYMVFGRADFLRLIGAAGAGGASRAAEAGAGGAAPSKLVLTFPLVPFVLIASRSTLSDVFLPALPVLFLATSASFDRRRAAASWPPSAAMAFAALPYVRAGYNDLLRRLFAKKEKEWMRQLQPRQGQSDEAEENNDDDNNNGGEGLAWPLNENIAGQAGPVEPQEGDLEVEIEVVDVEEEAEARPQLNEQEREAVEAAANADPDAAAALRLALEDRAEARNRRQNNNGEQRRREGNNNQFVISTTRAADLIMGALVFPAIASIAGELLRLALPTSWTTIPFVSPAPRSSGNGRWTGIFGASGFGGATVTGAAAAAAAASEMVPGRRTGILQTKWGRSIVGGCLFVVLKDMALLYSRYKLAQGQKKRRVVNWKDKE